MLHPASAAVACCALVGVASWCNRSVFGWLPDDPPSPGRKQHERPTPLAGVVILPATAPWFVAEGEFVLLLAAILAALVGFVDDRGKEKGRDLDWRWKACGLALAAAVAACCTTDATAEPGRAAAIALAVFVLTNATNFLDNTNGVATALSAASLLAATGGRGAEAALGFAALGFLPWNWPRARLFLGDAGAYSLGLVVGVAAVRSAFAGGPGLFCVVLQFADFVQVVIARVALGLPPWIGDRRHLTHIAQNLGVPAVVVAPLFATAAVAAALLA